MIQTLLFMDRTNPLTVEILLSNIEVSQQSSGLLSPVAEISLNPAPPPSPRPIVTPDTGWRIPIYVRNNKQYVRKVQHYVM